MMLYNHRQPVASSPLHLAVVALRGQSVAQPCFVPLPVTVQVDFGAALVHAHGDIPAATRAAHLCLFHGVVDCRLSVGRQDDAEGAGRQGLNLERNGDAPAAFHGLLLQPQAALLDAAGHTAVERGLIG